jgi:tRNA (guanine-N7-)-methyltransferase
MLASQKSAFEHYWSDYGLELNRHKLNPDQMFCRQAPLVIEIGFGMGHSLLQMAEQNPAINYIGIEVHRPGVGALLQGIAEKGLANLRIYCADAVEILQQAIADESLTGVQVFFPDPWHKRRHHKRRLIQAEFLQLVQRKLKLGGFIHIATDWHDYAEQALHLLEQNDGFSNASAN